MSKKESETKQRWASERERGFATAEDTAPQAFVEWWKGHDHCPQLCTGRDGRRGYGSGIPAHKAWQNECYRIEFKERGHEHAAGTGLNYAYYGWHRAEDAPRTSNPAILETHREWCRQRKKPDPAISRPMPEMMKDVRSFDDMKSLLDVVAENVDMNKAIGWTQADSDAANAEEPDWL